MDSRYAVRIGARRAEGGSENGAEKQKSLAWRKALYVFWLPDLGSNQGPTD